jgi:HD-like signal output (HDOD) protein/CheY-like chemotaxis protein
VKSILFVDDEAHVLEGLRVVLRKQRAIWNMKFVQSGEAALQELLASPYDLVVSDMRMPGMEGGTLLRQVRADYPHIARVVLSGQAEEDVSRRLFQVAHRFLAKPYLAVDLRQAIDRVFRLQAVLEEPGLRQTIARLGPLPGKPVLYGRLVEALEQPETRARDLAALIEEDGELASGILDLVRISGILGVGARPADVETAIGQLGVEVIKILALMAEILDVHADLPARTGFSLRALRNHNLFAGRVAQRLLGETATVHDGFAAAVLQDIGLLVLTRGLPGLFEEIVARARESSRPYDIVERSLLGSGHAEVGAYLLTLWGLPYGIVEAVANHHQPARAGATSLDAVAAVHAAGAFAEDVHPNHVAADLSIDSRLDLDYLGLIGASAELPRWGEMAIGEATAVTTRQQGPLGGAE